jgi:signal transduction histidine kinase
MGIEVLQVQENGISYYVVTIEDNGPGIPDLRKAELFSRLAPDRRPYHGGGLGLGLVKTLVDDYGGRVWVEDRVPGDHGQGCRFMVMLPVA